MRDSDHTVAMGALGFWVVVGDGQLSPVQRAAGKKAFVNFASVPKAVELTRLHFDSSGPEAVRERAAG